LRRDQLLAGALYRGRFARFPYVDSTPQYTPQSSVRDSTASTPSRLFPLPSLLPLPTTFAQSLPCNRNFDGESIVI
jgi:hypothetical protein